MLKRLLPWLVISQLLILLLCLTVYKQISLLSYTNVSFVIGALLILVSLAGYVTKGRFFDIVFFSFQHFFSSMDDKDRRPLSELVPQSYFFPFLTGIISLLLMLCTLMLYIF
ncbi:DUF3899 domain-containing protein [Lentibacillus sp. N15]|uniref:DUF3899 domain-containing protein n=1 Tax=Lentibacillus songyuanensis TaxID=3136161 RepID=UPI0031CC290F